VFFKTLKQQQKIKSFVGTTENALKTQNSTVLITMLLLLRLSKRTAWQWSLSNLIAFLRLNLLVHHSRDVGASGWIVKPRITQIEN